MLRCRSRLATVGTLLVSVLPQCKFDDDRVSSASTTGGAAAYHFAGGGSAFADAGPCGIYPDATYTAAQLANCTLVLESAPDTSGYSVELLVDCRSLWPTSEADGGLSWDYSVTDHTITFGAALCESLEANPTQRVDVRIHYPPLD